MCSRHTPAQSSPTRGGAAAARWAHNPKVAGSSPAPATNTANQGPRSVSGGLLRYQTSSRRPDPASAPTTTLRFPRAAPPPNLDFPNSGKLPALWHLNRMSALDDNLRHYSWAGAFGRGNPRAAVWRRRTKSPAPWPQATQRGRCGGEEANHGSHERRRSASQVSRVRGRRGRVRHFRQSDLRDSRRSEGRAWHPHRHHEARTGDDVHGRRLHPRLRQAGRTARGAGRGPVPRRLSSHERILLLNPCASNCGPGPTWRLETLIPQALEVPVVINVHIGDLTMPLAPQFAPVYQLPRTMPQQGLIQS